MCEESGATVAYCAIVCRVIAAAAMNCISSILNHNQTSLTIDSLGITPFNCRVPFLSFEVICRAIAEQFAGIVPLSASAKLKLQTRSGEYKYTSHAVQSCKLLVRCALTELDGIQWVQWEECGYDRLTQPAKLIPRQRLAHREHPHV